jgi:Leucine-rich repeat (LRR) protein
MFDCPVCDGRFIVPAPAPAQAAEPAPHEPHLPAAPPAEWNEPEAPPTPPPRRPPPIPSEDAVPDSAPAPCAAPGQEYDAPPESDVAPDAAPPVEQDEAPPSGSGAWRPGAGRRIWLGVVALIALLAALLSATGFYVRANRRERRELGEMLNRVKGSATGLRGVAETLVEKGRFEEALQVVNCAVDAAGDDVSCLNLKGNVLQTLLEFAEAENVYGKALALDPSHEQAKVNLELSRQMLQRGGKDRLSPGDLLGLASAFRSQGRPSAATAIMNRVGRDARALQKVYRDILTQAGVDARRISLNVRDDGGCELKIAEGSGLADLNPLRPVPLISLEVYAPVASLLPLRGMSLHSLSLTDAPVTDLAPLRGMPLRTLGLPGTSVADLTALSGMPLEQLTLGRTPVADLAPLKGMPLQRLNLAGTQVTDLSPLQGMPLKSLQLGGTRVRDLTALAGAPLETLELGGTPVSDLSPLRAMGLKSLDVSGTKITDLGPLARMPLTFLDVSGTQVMDLLPLQGMRLKRFAFSPERARAGIDAVRKMTSLDEINYKPAARFWTEYDKPTGEAPPPSTNGP